MARTSSINDYFYHLTFKCDLELQPTWTKISGGTSTPLGQQLCHNILKSMRKCTTYGPDKLSLWPFIIWLSSGTLTFNLPEQMFQMEYLLLKDNDFVKFILKSMHKCTSYDKLNLWQFYHLTVKCDLKLQPTWTKISSGTCTYTPRVNYFEIHAWMYKLWARQNPDGCTTHAKRTHIDRTETMSRSPPAGSTKKKNNVLFLSLMRAL